MKPGIYPNIPNADYHSGPGVSKSQLDVLDRTPLHLRTMLDAANDNEPTLSQLMGSAFHTAVLEPHLFDQEYAVELNPEDHPEAIRGRDQLVDVVETFNEGRLSKLLTGGKKADLVQRIIDAQKEMHLTEPYTQEHLESLKGDDLKGIIETLNQSRPGRISASGTMEAMAEAIRNEGGKLTLWSEVKQRWAQSVMGLSVLRQDQLTDIQGMMDSLRKHPAASKLLQGPGLAENSVYWNDPETGELCRIRPDWWRDDGIMVDLKSTDDASPEAFKKSVAKWRYHVQDAKYTEGAKQVGRPLREFVFVVVERQAPYAVAVYVLDEEAKELGRWEWRNNLNLYAECKKNESWPGHSERIERLGLPGYYLSVKG